MPYADETLSIKSRMRIDKRKKVWSESSKVEKLNSFEYYSFSTSVALHKCSKSQQTIENIFLRFSASFVCFLKKANDCHEWGEIKDGEKVCSWHFIALVEAKLNVISKSNHNNEHYLLLQNSLSHFFIAMISHPPFPLSSFFFAFP